MFRALCANHQEVKIVLYSIWYHHTCRWPYPYGHLQVWVFQVVSFFPLGIATKRLCAFITSPICAM